jgi:hypothetical protein
MARVVLDLPAPLARRAKKAGVLNRDTMRSLVEDELRRRRAARSLARLSARLRAAYDGPPLTDEQAREEVNQVIAEVRADGRGKPHAPRP